MLSLFEEEQLFDIGKKCTTHFEIPDAVLILRERFFEKKEADHFYAALLKNTPWQQHERKMYDKTVIDPRLSRWYGKDEINIVSPELTLIKKYVEAACDIEFDSVLLNLYRDGKDSVNWHSDKKPAGKNPPIASVSFGETRPFRIRHKFDKNIEPLEIPLTHGSFLLMAGPMQDFWEHHIPKTSKTIAPRINLTFRISS